jgi:serine/threonine protein kinase
MPKERSIDGLPAGYALDCYVIDSILGQGGFGITYLARDRRDGPNERWVALKEYFPVNSAARTRDARVWPRSRSDCGEFRYGLHRFIKEAEILTRFSHPNIVKVWRLIENNGTAYMVMSFEEGEQLDKALKRHRYRRRLRAGPQLRPSAPRPGARQHHHPVEPDARDHRFRSGAMLVRS